LLAVLAVSLFLPWQNGNGKSKAAALDTAVCVVKAIGQ